MLEILVNGKVPASKLSSSTINYIAKLASLNVTSSDFISAGKDTASFKAVFGKKVDGDTITVISDAKKLTFNVGFLKSLIQLSQSKGIEIVWTNKRGGLKDDSLTEL